MEKLDNPTQEDWFDIWAKEMLDAGYIEELVKEPDVPTFVLFEGLEKPHGKKKNVILRPTHYTPDRIIKWADKAKGIFFTPFDGDNKDWDSCFFHPQYEATRNFYYSILDIKGPVGNQKAYGSDFKFTQKWLWANTQQFVEKVMLAPAKLYKTEKSLSSYLWAATFTPERFLYTDKLSTNKTRPIPYRTIPNKKGKKFWEPISLKEFVEQKRSLISETPSKSDLK